MPQSRRLFITRFEWDYFYKSKIRRPSGYGQATSLHFQTNSSLHLSNSITECSPDTKQGSFTIHIDSDCIHKWVISFNNLSNNKFYYHYAWNWYGIEGEGTMNTLTNNVMSYPIYSSEKENSLSSTNIVGNTHSPGFNWDLFWIPSGSLTVSDSFIISNDYSSLSSGSQPIFQNTPFHGNQFDASPTTDSLQFTHSLSNNPD